MPDGCVHLPHVAAECCRSGTTSRPGRSRSSPSRSSRSTSSSGSGSGRRGVDKEVLKYGYYPCSVHGPCTAPAPRCSHAAWLPERLHARCSCTRAGSTSRGNMLFLWIFGNNVEDAMGRVRYAIFYLARRARGDRGADVRDAALGGADGASVPNIGASGAIAGVLGAYLVLLPNARVLTAIFVSSSSSGDPGRLRSSASGSCSSSWLGRAGPHAPESGGGVAFFAHVGGFVFGALTVRRSPSGRRSSPTLRAGELRASVRHALDELPPEIARRLENVAVVVEDENPEEPDLFGLFEEERVPAGAGHDLPAAARGVLPRPRRARARDPDHRPPRARALLRDRRGPARRARLRLSVAGRDRSRRAALSGCSACSCFSSPRSETTRNATPPDER